MPIKFRSCVSGLSLVLLDFFERIFNIFILRIEETQPIVFHMQFFKHSNWNAFNFQMKIFTIQLLRYSLLIHWYHLTGYICFVMSRNESYESLDSDIYTEKLMLYHQKKQREKKSDKTYQREMTWIMRDEKEWKRNVG